MREPQLAPADDLECAGAGVEPDEEAVARQPGRRLDAGRLDRVGLFGLGHVGIVCVLRPCVYPRPVVACAAARRSRAICCTAPRPLNAGLDSDRRLRRQVHQRPRHQEHHHDVEDRRQAEGEREALHLADGQDVEHRGGQEADGVAGQDRLARPCPTSRNRRPERTAFADLVFDAFEEHHERVGGGADTDDQTGDACQVQRVVDVSAEQYQDREYHCARSDQRQRREQPQHPVVQQRVHQHQRQPDCARDQTRPQRRQTQCGRNGFGLRRFERQRQGAVLQHVGELSCLIGGELSGDLSSATWDRFVDRGGADDLRVQCERGLRTDVRSGEVGPDVRAIGLELQVRRRTHRAACPGPNSRP